MNSDVQGKFSLIKKLKQQSVFRTWIPDLWEIFVDSEFPVQALALNQTYILRSSLHGEGTDHLLSGKSLSCKNLASAADFTEAKKIIFKQAGVAEVILQKQISYHTHYTLYVGKDFCFCEESFSKNKPQQCILTEQFASGGIKDQTLLETLVTALKQEGLSEVLVEWASGPEGLAVFQVNQLPSKQLSSYTHSRVLQLLQQNFTAWKKQKGIFTLFKEEIQAWRLREEFKQKRLQFNLQNGLRNWQSILHYYYLFCLLQKVKAEQKSWIAFLKSQERKDFLSRFSQAHLHIAQVLSQNLGSAQAGEFKMPTTAATTEFQQIFLGNGVWQGPLSNCLFVESLEPKHIYENSYQKILGPILSKDHRVLSHGFLAAAETGTKVLGGLSEANWTALNSASYVKIDFEHEVFECI